MSKLLLNGQTEIIGKVVKVIEGGFGEGQRAILARDIAEQHEVELKYVNKKIRENISRFNENDLIDLLSSSEELREFAEENNLIGSNRTQNVFLLSERGYTKLVAMMDNDNDKKWEVMDSIIDNYFHMREIINSREREKANLLLQIYDGGQEGVLASKRLSEMEVEEATKPLQDQIQGMKPIVDIVDTFINTDGSINIETFSKLLGIPKMGRNNMFKWLREKKILQGNNKPYQSYMKYFKIVPKVNRYTGNTDFITLVNYNGIVYLYRKLKEDGRICNRPIEEIIEDVKNLNIDR